MSLFRIMVVVLASLPWIVGLVAVNGISKSRVSRWAWHTGLAIDDRRGPIAHAELRRTYRIRRTGGLIGSATAASVLFTGGDHATTFVAVLGLALAGYGLGVIVAEITRRPSDATRRVTTVRARMTGTDVGAAQRAWAIGLTATGVVSSSVALAWPGDVPRFPIVVTLLVGPMFLAAMVWAERLPRWGSDEIEADVLAACRVAGVRVLWALSYFAGMSATIAGLATALRLQNWSTVMVIPQVMAVQLVVASARGERITAASRPATWGGRGSLETTGHAASR